MENGSYFTTNYDAMGDLASIIAILLLLATSLTATKFIPSSSRVPMQFGVNGEPTWFGTRWVALLFMPIAGIVCIMGLWIMIRQSTGLDPNHEAIIFVVRSLTAVIWVGAHALHLIFAARWVARQS